MLDKGLVGRLFILSVAVFVVLAGASLLTFLDTGEQWANAEATPSLGQQMRAGYDAADCEIKYKDPEMQAMCMQAKGLFDEPTGRNPAWKPLAAAAGVAAFMSLMLAAIQTQRTARRGEG